MDVLHHDDINRTKPVAFVMGRNYTARLCMIRAAGEAGCDIILIQTNKKATRDLRIDRKSKFIKKWHYCPEPRKEELIELLLGYQSLSVPKLLLPTDDYTASLIDTHLDLLRPFFLMPHVNHKQGAMLRIMDKNYQKELASGVGMNTAKGWICNYTNGQYTIPEDITYPCFTKPQESYNGQLKQYMKKCDEEKALKEHLSAIAQIYNRPILIEQFINIEKEYAVLGVSAGDITAIPAIIEMTSKRLGQTATGKIYSISRIPSLQQQLEDFIKKTRLTGIFDIDLYENNGKIFFNELNVRLGASGFALMSSIENLPKIFINYLLNGNNEKYVAISDFKEKKFASEKVLREKYYACELTFKEYRKSISEAEILSLKYVGDMGPYYEFSKMDKFLPIWRKLRKIKKIFK